MLRRKNKGERPIRAAAAEYPSGTCVITKGQPYYISGKMRLRIPSQRVLDSWSFPIIVEAHESALEKYPIGGTLGFRDGTLIKNIMDARMYIISKSQKRPVASPSVLAYLNLQEKDAILVSQAECNLHKEGEALTDGIN